MTHRMLPVLMVTTGVLLAGCQDEFPTQSRLQGLAPGGRAHFALVNGPVTPIDGGLVSGTLVTIDKRAGVQMFPRVSGDLMCYTDHDVNQIRYYRFSTGANNAITPPDVGLDANCAIEGSHIAFDHVSVDVWTDVFDANTSIVTSINHVPGEKHYDVAIGGTSVVFMDTFLPPPPSFATSTHVFVADLSSPSQATMLSGGTTVQDRPKLSPDGNVLVWRSLLPSSAQMLKALRTNGIWGVPTVIAMPGDIPVTDGTYIASIGDGTEDLDIYIQAVSGGPVQQLVIPGDQADVRISSGVLVFRTFDPIFGEDLMVYIMASNTLYKLTNTPSVPKVWPDISVLNNGAVRVVWQEPFENGDIFGLTFGGTTPTFTFGGFQGPLAGGSGTASAGQVISIKFSLGGDQGLNIFAAGSPSSIEISCVTSAPTGTTVPTVTMGANALVYDPLSNLYSYKWKTDKAWAGTCRRLTIQFSDGQTVTANIAFK